MHSSSLLSFRNRLFVLIILVVAITACSPSEDQLQFEQEAYRLPVGFTETNDRGIVQREDIDDWRIAPMFYRLITVNPIYPNPTSGNDLRLQVYIERTEAIFGIEVVRFDPRSVTNPYLTIYRNTQAPLAPGILNITIPFQVIFPQYPSLDDRGLHRIIVFDNRSNVITYGDLMLE